MKPQVKFHTQNKYFLLSKDADFHYNMREVRERQNKVKSYGFGFVFLNLQKS